MKEWTSLLESIPREIKNHLRKINHPEYRETVEIHQLRDMESTIYQSARLVFIGLVISALTISGAMTFETANTEMLYGFPIISLSMFVLAALLFVRFFLKNK
jgi:hypothetical protein